MNDIPLKQIIESALSKIGSVADVNTVVGEPIVIDGGITVVPFSKVSVGTSDAAQTAMLYGAISGAMANLTHAILNYRHKRGAEIYSECKPDFLSESMDIYVDIGASVMLWSYVITLFSLGIKALWGFLKLKFKYRKNIPAKHGENPLKNKNP